MTLNRTERLRDSRTQATSMSLPVAIHRRLDLLAEAAADLNPTRAELIGMLIAEAEPNVEVETRLLAYRKKTVGDVVPGPAEDPSVVVPLRQPGRPRSAS